MSCLSVSIAAVSVFVSYSTLISSSPLHQKTWKLNGLVVYHLDFMPQVLFFFFFFPSLMGRVLSLRVYLTFSGACVHMKIYAYIIQPIAVALLEDVTG